MNSDKICSAAIPMAASSSKDLAKKKRVNRSAKLKQCKLDARREQWLSQVKNKACKDETDTDGGFTKSIMHTKENELSARKLNIKPNDRECQRSIHHYSDSDSPSNSPDSRTSSMSGTNFTSSSRGSGSSSSGGSCNGSMIGEDEEEGNDGCLDDWEAVADALASSSVPLPGIEIQKNSKPRLESVLLPVAQQNNSRAWKADDAFRPHSLPSFSKQLSFPMNNNSKRHHHHHHHHLHHHNNNNIVTSSAPTSCPICCEELDFTDSSFHPCSCGFRLCLFCHKRIVEDDGRCPGCRKEYSYSYGGISSLNIQLGRSCSMIARF